MNLTLSLTDFLIAFSEALDHICPAVVDHHKDVAYWSGQLALGAGLSEERTRLTVQTALVHDIGIFSLKDRLASLSFEFEMEGTHALAGSMLLEYSPIFERHAHIIRHHHDPYSDSTPENPVPLESQIIFLADRVAVLIDKTKPLPSQRRAILDMLRAHSGTKFNPELTEVFASQLRRETAWLDLSHDRDRKTRALLGDDPVTLDDEALLGLERLLVRSIDFRSRYTAAHSAAVSYVAHQLAKYSGYDEEGQMMMRIAGGLHDIGKVIVPSEVLDKPGPLTPEETALVLEHPYHTYRILSSLKGMGRYAEIAAQHHERTDGTGYPFHLTSEGMHPESLLLTVADMFTALAEDRSYRAGMPRVKVQHILERFAEANPNTRDTVRVVMAHYDSLQSGIRKVFSDTLQEYETFEWRMRQILGDIAN